MRTNMVGISALFWKDVSLFLLQGQKTYHAVMELVVNVLHLVKI